MQGAQPSARFSEESCFSEGSFEAACWGSRMVLRGSEAFCGDPRDFPRFFPVVTLCWTCNFENISKVSLLGKEAAWLRRLIANLSVLRMEKAGRILDG